MLIKGFCLDKLTAVLAGCFYIKVVLYVMLLIRPQGKGNNSEYILHQNLSSARSYIKEEITDHFISFLGNLQIS